MPKPQASAAQCLSPDDVEAAFYEALQTGDLEKLMACWADDEEIVCVHPGGPRLLGASQIRSSFEAMFANGRPARTWQSVSVLGPSACMRCNRSAPACTAWSSGSIS